MEARLPHLPGLDGLRGLAIAAVVAYHAGAPWLPGGFFGVSLFFTLSGYLVTSLLLTERAATGAVDVVAFWRRRARRLLPAALVTLAGVVVVAALAGGLPGLEGDVVASLLYVQNWHLLWSGSSYGTAVGEPSPLLHLWSLSIEEQWYLLLPLVATVALRRGRRWFAVALLVVLGLSVAAQLWHAASFDRVYYGTDTRAAELAVGALAALVLPPRRQAAATRASAAWPVLGVAGVVALWVLASDGDAWLVSGGLVAVAAVGAVAVTGAATPAGARLLGRRPLAGLGRISYAVYLVHWPVMVWVTEARTGWPRPAVVATQLALTLALATLSTRVVEEPVRRGTALAGGAFARVTVTGGVAVVLAVVALPLDDPFEVTTAFAAPASPAAPVPTVAAPPTTATPPADRTAAQERRLAEEAADSARSAGPADVVWFVGDSVPALVVEDATAALAAEGVRLVNLAQPACDGARGLGPMRQARGRVLDEPEGCGEWEQQWPLALAAEPPDAVVVVLGAAALFDREIDGRWQGPCSAELRARYEPEVVARLAWLQANSGGPVVLSTMPWFGREARFFAQSDHLERSDCLNEVYDAARVAVPGVGTLDLRGWLCPDGPSSCRLPRVDGVHLRGDAAIETARWAVSEVLSG
jgi:peptidoglycan/LPS O-acetylase OafA/YrhL